MDVELHMLRVVQVQFSFLFSFGGCVCFRTCCAVVVSIVVCFFFFFAFDVGCHDSPVCLLSVVVRGSALYLVLGLLLILPAALLMWCAGRSVRRC